MPWKNSKFQSPNPNTTSKNKSQKMATVALILIAFLVGSAPTARAEHSKTLEQHTAVKPGEKIVIEGISGSDVKVHSWEKNEISVKLYLSISSSDDEYETNFTENTKLTEEHNGGEVRVKLDEYSESMHFSFGSLFHGMYVSKNITGDVYVPESNPLTMDFRYGTIELNDMKAELRLIGTSNHISVKNCGDVQEIDNPYGTTDVSMSGGALDLRGTSSTVTVTDFNGPAHLDADYSTVTLGKISGEVNVADKSGKVNVTDVQANVDLDANYSTLTIANITGNLAVQCTSGRISVETLTGAARIDAEYSTIELLHWKNTDSSASTITGKSGRLTIGDAATALRIDDPYSTITLRRVTGNVQVSTVSGNIKGETITGNLTARSTYTPITIHDLTAANISVTDQSNNIEISTLNVPNTIDIHSRSGAINLSMPAGFQGDVDMSADYGKIDTNLPVKLKTMQSSAVAIGKVGTKAGSLSVETTSGNISVQAGSN
jgi:DUF4097 and DUF4098 domain-containing protein YvlB